MTQHKSAMPIAKEGMSIIVGLLLLLVVVFFVSDGMLDTLVVLGLFLGALYVFRTPNRTPAYFEEGAIVAPCDGIISSIEPLMCKGILQSECVKITIHTRLGDVGILSAPIGGTIDIVSHTKGMQLSLFSPKSHVLNEHAKVVFRDYQEHTVVLKHRLQRGNVAISLREPLDHTIELGQHYGFMAHGETLLFVPASTRLAVKKGMTIEASQTLLGYFA